MQFFLSLLLHIDPLFPLTIVLTLPLSHPHFINFYLDFLLKLSFLSQLKNKSKVYYLHPSLYASFSLMLLRRSCGLFECLISFPQLYMDSTISYTLQSNELKNLLKEIDIETIENTLNQVHLMISPIIIPNQPSK